MKLFKVSIMVLALVICLGNSTSTALNDFAVTIVEDHTVEGVYAQAQSTVSVSAEVAMVVPSQAAQKPSASVDSSSPLLPAAYHPDSVRLGNASRYSPPDFNRYLDTSEKKQAFYNYLLPMIHKANQEVTQERAWLNAMGDLLLAGVPLSENQLLALSRVEKRYDLGKQRHGKNEVDEQNMLTTAKRIGALINRVDVVPASLIVAQAAKESGWGTSRFATQGNNFFGIWCFYQGCGLTPLQRTEGFTHEVATFESVEQGVRYYVRTINTHVAYNDLRQLRADARLSDEQSPGELLANGLLRYSERGLAYVREVQSMIRHNNLQRFTRVYSA
jgi:Bax protein